MHVRSTRSVSPDFYLTFGKLSLCIYKPGWVMDSDIELLLQDRNNWAIEV